MTLPIVRLRRVWGGETDGGSERDCDSRSDSDGIVESLELHCAERYWPSLIRGCVFADTDAHEPLAEGGWTVGYCTIVPVEVAAAAPWDEDVGSEADLGRSEGVMVEYEASEYARDSVELTGRGEAFPGPTGEFTTAKSNRLGEPGDPRMDGR